MKKLVSSIIIASSIFAVSVSVVEAKTKSVKKPTAICRDGSYSYSANRKGTCSHHKGVKVWLK